MILESIYFLLIGLIAYIITIIIINGAFGKYISSIEKQTKQINEHSKIINNYVIVSSTDLSGKIKYVSEAFCKISNYTKEELIGKSHNIIRHPDTPVITFRDIWDTITSGKVWEGELKNKKKNGGFFWVKVFISPTYSLDGKIKGYTAIHSDITDKKLIEKISQTDKLTQVYNRLKLDETLLIETERSNRYKTPLSIILLDIDNFKSVNDTYGHQVGDRVLIQTSKVLLQHLRRTDTLGRWGGEEFLIICSQTDIEGSSSLAEYLRQSLSQYPFDSVEHKTASFGVTQYIQGEKLSDFLKRCDKALYQSKNSGRNRVTLL